MKKLNLCIHCGGKEVPFEEIENAPVGAPLSDRHRPIPHVEVINAVRDAAGTYGFQIHEEAHALSHEGNRYFGLMQIGSEGASLSDYSWVMGLRNSHDRSFSVALVGGAGVFVCDNLSFIGEIKVSRRHTIHCLRDLPGKVTEAFGKVVNLRVQMDQRFDAYRETSLSDTRAKAMIFDSMQINVIPKTVGLDVYKEWHKPTHDEFKSRTVWSLFNSVTELLKGRMSADALSVRTSKLHLLADKACNLQPMELAV